MSQGHGFVRGRIKQGDRRQAKGEIPDDIPANNPRHKPKPNPEHLILKHIRHPAARGLPEHIHRKRRHWKNQSLLLVPLFVKNYTRKKTRSNQRQTRHQPPEQRPHPGQPRDSPIHLHPGKQLPDHRLRFLWKQPVREIGHHHLSHPVLRRSIVSRSRNIGHHIHRPPDTRQIPHQPHHEKHRQHLDPGQCPPPRKQLQHRIDTQPDHKRQSHRYGHVILHQIPPEIGHEKRHPHNREHTYHQRARRHPFTECPGPFFHHLLFICSPNTFTHRNCFNKPKATSAICSPQPGAKTLASGS